MSKEPALKRIRLDEAAPKVLAGGADNRTHLDTSRREAALGKEAMQALRSLNVLIIGCRGAGIEAAKNVTLLGPKALTVWDPQVACVEDMGCNFYLDKSSVDRRVPRSKACSAMLGELNPFCKTTSSVLPFEMLLMEVSKKKFSTVVVTDLLCIKAKQLRAVSNCCHAKNVTFLMALASGVTASLFADFGPHHVIKDPDGQPTNVCVVESLKILTLHKDDAAGWLKPEVGFVEGARMILINIANDKKKALENGTMVSTHGWETGTHVKLSDFPGLLTNLNGATGVKIIRVFRRISREHQDPATGKTRIVTREYTQFHQLMLDVSKARTSRGTPLNISTQAWKSYVTGGILTEQKPVRKVSFKSLEQSLADPGHELNELTRFDMKVMDTVPAGPQYCDQEGWSKGTGRHIHLAWHAVLAFESINGFYPRIHNTVDSKQMLELAKKAAKKVKFNGRTPFLDNGPLDEKRILLFSRLFRTELCGLAAFVGGVVAQEIVKQAGKYTPLSQWLHWDDLALAAPDLSDTVNILPSRYSHQISIFGKAWQQRVFKQKVFLVGAGALGCEYIKELALMGVGCNGGHVTVTDMDSIEASNLTRQFLFRVKHLNMQKSEVAAQAACNFNSQFSVTAMTAENNDAKGMVAPSTETTFTDAFWEDKDLVWNALDNVQARRYVDTKCLWHGKPLLESGTLSTQANSEIFLPFKSISYIDGVEPEPDNIAMCTVRDFPHLPLHCIEWAKVDFENKFVEGMTMFNKYVENKVEFFRMVDQLEFPGDILESVSALVRLQIKGRKSFTECISLAFSFFCTQFRDRIFKIIQMRPKDYVSKTGKNFWSGHKRFPRVVEWNANKEEMELASAYIFSCANLYAYALRVKQVADLSTFNKLMETLKLSPEEWDPSMGSTSMEVEGEENDGEEDNVMPEDKSIIATWRDFLADTSTSNLMSVRVTKFEKDDDTNHHVDFITHAANLRAWNYKISPSTRHQVRVVAGKILPALVTTTAMITGLQTLEFCKLMMGLQFSNQSAFLGWNINLATGTFNSYNATDPPAVRHGLPPLGTQRESDLMHTEKVVTDGREELRQVRHKAYPCGWTNWDKLICDAGNLTGPQFAEWMRKFQGFGIITECIYCAGFSLWNSDLAPDSVESNVPLANILAHKLTSGARKQGQGVLRVQKMLTMLNRDRKYGVTIKPVNGNLFDLHVILNGPKGTPYEGGKFLISVKLPFTYPNAAPKVRFLTKIYHINIDANGVPCPGQIGISNWSPANNISGLLRNIADKMGDPDATVPRYEAVKGAAYDTDPAGYFRLAAEWTRLYATTKAVDNNVDKSVEPSFVSAAEYTSADLGIIGRNYLVFDTVQFDEATGRPCGGYYRDNDGNVADLPRIKFIFQAASSHSVDAAQVLAPSTASKIDVVPENKARLSYLNAEAIESKVVPEGTLRQRIVEFAQEHDQTPLEDITAVYWLEPQRAARYAASDQFEGIDPDGLNAACVVGTWEEMEEPYEMVVLLADGEDGIEPYEVVTGEDKIMYSDDPPMMFPEFQWERDSAWMVATAAKESLASWRKGLFTSYEKQLKKTPPECLAALGRMLWQGPLTKLYGRANETMFPMPEEEKSDWKLVNAAGKTTFLPRPIFAIRTWNPVTRSYDLYENHLDGAPTEDDIEDWFKEAVCHLKSCFGGDQAPDENILEIYNQDLLCPTFLDAINTGGANKWTKIVMETRGVHAGEKKL